VLQVTAKPYWYLRHGETDWNKQGLSQGRTDIPLNATGLEQAEKAGEVLGRLWREGVFGATRIVSSPLGRAHVTAEIARDRIKAAGGPDLAISLDADLLEVCFGEQEGEPMGDWYDPWIAGEITPAGGESFATLRHRGTMALNRALEGEGPPLVVAHGALFRALRSAMGLPANVRLANAVPLLVTPPAEGRGWDVEQMG